MDTTSRTRRAILNEGLPRVNGLLLACVIGCLACWAAVAYLIALIT